MELTEGKVGHVRRPSVLRRVLCKLGIHRRPWTFPERGMTHACGAHCSAQWRAIYDGIFPGWRRVR